MTKLINRLLCIFLLCNEFVMAQDAQQILRQSYEKCVSLQQGSFSLKEWWKPMSKSDTIQRNYQCTFKKLPSDTLFSIAFKRSSLVDGKDVYSVIYSGSELLLCGTYDSSAEYFDNVKWADEIKRISYNFEMFGPFTSKTNSPFPNYSTNDSSIYQYKYSGTQLIGKNDCYVIELIRKPYTDTLDNFMMMYHLTRFWVDKKSTLTIGYEDIKKMVLQGDTMDQYFKYQISNLNFNKLNTDSILSRKSVPSFYKYKEHKLYEPAPLLADSTIPPDWEVRTLSNEILKLSDLKGKLVLIDFFYKSCYPCMLAIPVLQKLYEKYKENGFVVVGLDTQDEEKDNMPEFLGKKGVTYPVALTKGQQIEKLYKVTGFPTFYIVGKNGLILKSEIGFGDVMEKELDELIRSNL